jgi:hypothetical protein
VILVASLETSLKDNSEASAVKFGPISKLKLNSKSQAILQAILQANLEVFFYRLRRLLGQLGQQVRSQPLFSRAEAAIFNKGGHLKRRSPSPLEVTIFTRRRHSRRRSTSWPEVTIFAGSHHLRRKSPSLPGGHPGGHHLHPEVAILARGRHLSRTSRAACQGRTPRRSLSGISLRVSSSTSLQLQIQDTLFFQRDSTLTVTLRSLPLDREADIAVKAVIMGSNRTVDHNLHPMDASMDASEPLEVETQIKPEDDSINGEPLNLLPMDVLDQLEAGVGIKPDDDGRAGEEAEDPFGINLGTIPRPQSHQRYSPGIFMTPVPAQAGDAKFEPGQADNVDPTNPTNKATRRIVTAIDKMCIPVYQGMFSVGINANEDRFEQRVWTSVVGTSSDFSLRHMLKGGIKCPTKHLQLDLPVAEYFQSIGRPVVKKSDKDNEIERLLDAIVEGRVNAFESDGNGMYLG